MLYNGNRQVDLIYPIVRRKRCSIGFFVVCMLCGASLVITACGGESQSDTPVVQPTALFNNVNVQSLSGSSPTNFTLTQTINSATGVTYMLPEGWDIQDNESVSNFASDEDAVLDFMNAEKRDTRWLLIGSFGVASIRETDQLAGLTNIADAAPILSAYYYTEDNPVVAPSIITLADGRQAYFVINNNDGIFNVSYFLTGAEGVFITVFFSGSEASINASRDLMNAIVTSAVYTK